MHFLFCKAEYFIECLALNQKEQKIKKEKKAFQKIRILPLKNSQIVAASQLKVLKE